MADWKTYAKAARNTARKQAPEVKRSAQDSARRGSQRAGDYVRAAGRVVEESRREDRPRADDEPRPEREPRSGSARPSDGEGHREARREYDPRPDLASQPERAPRADDGHRTGREPRTERSERPEQDRRPAVDTDRLRRGAAAYYTVAERRVRGAQLGPRIMRAVRDALLIGVSLFAIWVVLAAAGLQIPFSAVLIAVGVIVLISFGTSLYASSKRSRDRAAADEIDDADADDS